LTLYCSYQVPLLARSGPSCEARDLLRAGFRHAPSLFYGIITNAAFKSDHSAVRAPDRVQQVIDKVCKHATELGLPTVIIEKVYRTMIDAFIDYELRQYDPFRQEKC
jgi:hypothetical protein